MLIAFFGAPHSGKTTVAMGLSYHLKLGGYAVEYLPENVRHHMTVLRHQGLPLHLPQPELYYAERDRQKMYKETLPDSVIIADVICNTGELYGLELATDIIARDLDMYDLVFFCPLFADIYDQFIQKDPNRIHGLHELAGIQKAAEKILDKYDLSGRLHILDQNSAHDRVAAAFAAVEQFLGKSQLNKQVA